MTRRAGRFRPGIAPSYRSVPSSRVFGRRLLEALEPRNLLTTVPGASISVELDHSYEPTALIVQFKQESQYAGSLRAHTAGNIAATQWEIAPGLREVTIAPGAPLEAALAAFASDPNVLFAEPDYRVRLNMMPSDPKFVSDQWYLNNTGQYEEPAGADINAPEAWEISLGDPGVVVAVIDTGVDYTHPDLAANMWQNEGEVPSNGIDDDGNGYVDDIFGYDFANRDHDPMDDHLHGTHIAGTIAAVADNGIGVVGVAPGVRIMALKFMDETGNGLTSDAISALNYAVANGASISNNSFGGGPVSQAFKTAIQNAGGSGHIFVAAAGNYGNNNDANPFYPANYELDNIITVAATDAADSLAWFSNYGKRSVDIGAPGLDIYSTFPTAPTLEMVDRGITEPYGLLSGTSMAAPVVAGVLALVRSQNDGMSAHEVIEQVLATADRSPALVAKTSSGGRVNAAAAMGLAPVDQTLPQIVSSDPTGPASAPVGQIRFTFSEPIDASSFGLNDVLAFSGPLGPIEVFGVEASPDSKKFTVSFELQSEPGEYTMLIGPHIHDFSGNEIDQDEDGQGGIDGSDEYTAVFSIAAAQALRFESTDVPLEIREFDTLVSYLTIPEDLPIADLNLQVNLSFPRAGDLHVWLVSPADTVITLSYRHGGEASDFSDTWFDDEADLYLSEGEAPFLGSYRPDDPLSILNSENAQGTWRLFVQNVSDEVQVGFLNAWAVEIVRRESGGSGGGEEEEPNLPPVTVDDYFSTVQSTPLLLTADDLLGNDSDPDGDFLEITSVRSVVGGTVELQEDGTILFEPLFETLGLASFDYTVSDGLQTSVGHAFVALQARFNLHNGFDVNHDGYVTAYDALLIINYLNGYGAAPIIGIGTASTTRLYYDVVPDNIIAASDSLAVINELNAHGAGPVATGLPQGRTAASSSVSADNVDGLLSTDEKLNWLSKR